MPDADTDAHAHAHAHDNSSVCITNKYIITINAYDCVVGVVM
jgi:hypothetical protein